MASVRDAIATMARNGARDIDLELIGWLKQAYAAT